MPEGGGGGGMHGITTPAEYRTACEEATIQYPGGGGYFFEINNSGQAVHEIIFKEPF